MTKIIEKDGVKYLILGNKAIPISGIDVDGKPIIKCQSQEIPNANGGKDCKVFIPCLTIQSETKSL